MKIIAIFFAATSFFGLIGYNLRPAEVPSDAAKVQAETGKPGSMFKRSPVLLELFTSEGCSSCPPADKNLIYFNEKQPIAGAEVITLSMHVDYWNRLGWADPFSSAAYSERQGFYSNSFGLDGVYTPQMVVDGSSQFVGSNQGDAEKSIDAAVKSAKATVELIVGADNKLTVKIASIPEHTLANVFLAIAEDDLSTAVKRGENGGRMLPHDSVVRELRTIGKIGAKDNTFETETALKFQASWKKPNLKVVVFVQQEKGSRVLGVNQARL